MRRKYVLTTEVPDRTPATVEVGDITEQEDGTLRVRLFCGPIVFREITGKPEPEIDLTQFMSEIRRAHAAAGRLAAARDLLLKSQCTTPVNVMRYLAEVLRFEGLADLQRIAAPTLCITGSVDTIVMPDTAQVIASHVQRGRCKIITGAGHYPYLTHDDAFTPLVLQHMAERAPSADDKVSQHAAN